MNDEETVEAWFKYVGQKTSEFSEVLIRHGVAVTPEIEKEISHLVVNVIAHIAIEQSRGK